MMQKRFKYVTCQEEPGKHINTKFSISRTIPNMKRIEALYTKDLSDFLHSLKQQEAIKMLGLNYKTFCG